MGGSWRRRVGILALLLAAGLLAGCGAIEPYDGPPRYGNFRGTHGA